MKKLILTLSIVAILIPVIALASGYGHSTSGGSSTSGFRVGVGPNGKVGFGFHMGGTRYYNRSVHHRPVHLPAYGGRYRYPRYNRYRYYSPHYMPPVYQPVVYQTVPSPPIQRTVYIEPPIPQVQYVPGASATVTRADGTKEIIYLEGAKIRGASEPQKTVYVENIPTPDELLKRQQAQEISDMNSLLHKADVQTLKNRLEYKIEQLDYERERYKQARESDTGRD